MSLKIIRLQAENFKKIRVIDVRPSSNVIKITGENGSGKSSLLDAIFALFGGRASVPPKPIRDGEDQAVIQADLGKYIVQRIFTRADKQPPIIVRPKEGGVGGMAGKPIKSPQDLLDTLLGDLTFDPLEFARMKPKDQYEELRRIVKLGPELDELDRLNQKDYDERTGINRRQKEAAAEAKMIDVPENLPDERINVAILSEEMEKAIKHNADIEKRKIGRGTHAQRMEDMKKRAQARADALPATLDKISRGRDDRIADCRKQIAELERQIADAYKHAEADVAEATKSATLFVAEMKLETDKIQKNLDSAEPIPEPKDVLVFKEQMSNAQSINSGIDARERYCQRQAEADLYEKKVKELTAAMDERKAKKLEMIAAAKMPVPGLSIGDGMVIYNDVPFEQASSSEQLRVSVAIAMAANPELRVLRIKDGSLLDSKSWKVLEEMVAEHQFQAWVEAVSDDKSIGIVMEDGSVVVDNYMAHDDFDKEEPVDSRGEWDSPGMQE